MPHSSLTRREFLRLAAAGIGTLMIPKGLLEPRLPPRDWPTLPLAGLPDRVQEILARVPRTAVSPNGYLVLYDEAGIARGDVPLAPTRWNQENRKPYHRLNTRRSWGIVLHWFGDKENFPGDLAAYMRGFDGLRKVGEDVIRTSAHFLVGGGKPAADVEEPRGPLGIVQTQVPSPNGVPYVASHLRSPDYQAHAEKKQYFVRAFYQLGYAEPGAHSLLQEIYDGRPGDPNMRTIAIEACGYNFDHPGHTPSVQQTANLLSVVWALMKRYNIPASHILGHHELQLGKADPGKKYLALIRYLVGAKALLEDDPAMKALVFGQFLGPDSDPVTAVGKYFKFVYDYMLAVSAHRLVYEWESASQFWFLYDRIAENPTGLRAASKFLLPVQSTDPEFGHHFLNPENHEGFDFYPHMPARDRLRAFSSPVRLVADGLCLFTGDSSGCVPGKTAIFRHRQPDGAEVCSVFGHLAGLGDLKVGTVYPAGYALGSIQSEYAHLNPFLHFAVAYGATWKTDLSHRPSIPLNAGATWIRHRYLDPSGYLTSRE